jgi:hypothetical protein
MRVHVPQPFSINMAGPHGPYELACSPLNDDPWEGSIATVISGVSILWSIEETVVEEDGLCLIGLTNDPVDVWRDTYLFLLWPEANPPRIEYYGGQGLWRCDLAEGAPIVR